MTKTLANQSDMNNFNLIKLNLKTSLITKASDWLFLRIVLKLTNAWASLHDMPLITVSKLQYITRVHDFLQG